MIKKGGVSWRLGYLVTDCKNECLYIVAAVLVAVAPHTMLGGNHLRRGPSDPSSDSGGLRDLRSVKSTPTNNRNSYLCAELGTEIIYTYLSTYFLCKYVLNSPTVHKEF